MSKTALTLELERKIYKETSKQGVFGCFEVTIGWWGKERVDYLTYDTKGIWRCYEIKVSKSDFHSKAKTTFIGNYNYYVMTKELYDEVKEEIPAHIGVYLGNVLVKKSRKQSLGIEDDILKNSMIRSLSRENNKAIEAGDINFINKLKYKVNMAEKSEKEYRAKEMGLRNALYEICKVYNLNREEIRDMIRKEIN